MSFRIKLKKECGFMDFEYAKLKDGIRITKYIGAAESVTIPATIEDFPVTEIGLSAF